MNYRHAYHAGNFADVVKHVLVTLLLDHLHKKETPFCVIDTHAGIGRYDLESVEAGKTGEAREGVLRLLDGGPLPPVFDAYRSALASVNPEWPKLRFYPGSPRIIRGLLRPQDRMAAVELHPEDAQALKREFAGDSQVGVHLQDAYIALKALLPPKERRGVVLIDPPFEVKDEFRRLAKGLAEALRRWPIGMFGVWYPIKERALVERFLTEVANFGRPCLTAELYRFPPDDPERLNGCGLMVLNPPWKFDEAVAGPLPVLHDRMGAVGGTQVRWLTEER
jgi:23S rRNA (adenine2030-N6)-methyltransferase